MTFDKAGPGTEPGDHGPKLGLMGGTFDPIHLAHLITAETVFESLGLTKVLFIPTGSPPHKRHYPVTPAGHRYEMVRLAVEGNPKFEASRMEIDRAGLSFTVDTLTEMTTRVAPGASLYFITGTDAILSVGTWRQPERLFTMCRFVAVHRPGLDPDAAGERLDRLEERYNCRIIRAAVPAVDISSSNIRRRVCEQKTIRYLVPEAVEAYIRDYGIYQPDR